MASLSNEITSMQAYPETQKEEFLQTTGHKCST